MRGLLGLSVIALGLLLAGGLLVGLTVLAATGIGWLLSRFLPFSLYEATLLSLVALSWPIYLAIQIIKSTPVSTGAYESEEKEQAIPSIPRWRQPLKRPGRSANIDPDDWCPCGSGKKYKHCHGRKM